MRIATFSLSRIAHNIGVGACYTLAAVAVFLPLALTTGCSGGPGIKATSADSAAPIEVIEEEDTGGALDTGDLLDTGAVAASLDLTAAAGADSAITLGVQTDVAHALPAWFI